MGKTQQRSDAVRQASRFVVRLYREQLPEWAVYHSPEHTLEVVQATREIGKGSGLEAREIEIVLLAAWFHDTGYTVLAKGHEEESVRIASEFLSGIEYPKRGIARIARCIRATRVPQRPRTLLERVLCDADLCSLGRRSYLKQNDRLKAEIEKRERVSLEDGIWLRRSLRFLRSHRFHTRYARAKLEAGRRANVARLNGVFGDRE